MHAAAAAQIARPQHQDARDGRNGDVRGIARITVECERIEADARIEQRDMARKAVAAQVIELRRARCVDEVIPSEVRTGFIAELAILAEAECLDPPSGLPLRRWLILLSPMVVLRVVLLLLSFETFNIFSMIMNIQFERPLAKHWDDWFRRV